MPAQYAHYRFGKALLPLLPAEYRSTCLRFRQLYDIGLQGPDIFFYHNTLIPDSIVKLGKDYHQYTGEDFFTHACEVLRAEPSEAGRAYLYGLLAHYCLDSACHPFVHEQTDEGPIGHTELEKEFERYLLVQDGKRPPHTYDFSGHMRLTPGECDTVSLFYEDMNPLTIRRSIKNMAWAISWLASPKGFWRSTLNVAVAIVGKRFSDQLIPRFPNKNCAHLDEPLMELYDLALAQYPGMLAGLLAHLDHDEPLGQKFQPPFG